MADLIDFELPQKSEGIIKVIGVGGGGGNAVNHMYRQGIVDVDFAVCNTDAQALLNSPIPQRVQLGASLTEGRGAGNKPAVGRDAAEENIADVENILGDNTKMVFITAGMGGGTGTGAAPVIAAAARKLDLLTVGIVTIPFRNEGRRRIQQAVEGIREMEGHVDSLLVINNEHIREMYGDFPISKAFAKADDVLAIAAKGIAEIITCHGFINVDFEDVKTVMQDSGVAIMGSFKANGENRALRAVEGALNSPLLNNNDIRGARNILVNISSGEKMEATMDEMNLINEYVQNKAGNVADLIYGVAVNQELEDYISVTVIATGFKTSSIPEMGGGDAVAIEKVKLNDEPKSTFSSFSVAENGSRETKEESTSVSPGGDDVFSKLYGSSQKDEQPEPAPVLKQVMQVDFADTDETYVDELSSVPAYKRKNMKLDNENPSVSVNPKISRISLSDEDGEPRLRKNNSFLHDKAD